MANERWPVLSGNSEVIPTTNGTLQTADMSTSQVDNCQVYLEFFSDSAGTVAVTPTGGTATCNGSPMGNNYLAASNSSIINATACGTPNSTYTPPFFQGRMARGQVTFSGITGAAFARVTFWRY